VTQRRHVRYALIEGTADQVDFASRLSKHRVEPIRSRRDPRLACGRHSP
jgi:hypothetical protein